MRVIQVDWTDYLYEAVAILNLDRNIWFWTLF